MGRRPPCRLAGRALAGQNVEDDVGRVDTLSDRFRAGRLDRWQPVGEHRGEDVDHLSIAIVGAGMAFKRHWRARSWDRFCVPRPFSPAACVVPPPVVVPNGADRDTIEDCRREVERRMQAATLEAEAWVEEL